MRVSSLVYPDFAADAVGRRLGTDHEMISILTDESTLVLASLNIGHLTSILITFHTCLIAVLLIHPET